MFKTKTLRGVLFFFLPPELWGKESATSLLLPSPFYEYLSNVEPYQIPPKVITACGNKIVITIGIHTFFIVEYVKEIKRNLL